MKRQSNPGATRALVKKVKPNYPAISVQPIVVCNVLPAPVVEFVLPNGAATNYVQIGLWDDAWNPVNGLLYNGQMENANFIGRDSRSFRIRVTDPDAVQRGAVTVTVQWWTRRIDHQNHDLLEDDDHPATSDLTLTLDLVTNTYLSNRIMLVTDADDAGQGTHTGLGGGGIVQAGQADHRLRGVSVSAQYGLDGSVRVSYDHLNATYMSPIVTDATVFNRNPDERRRIVVHLVKVLDNTALAGGVCTTTDGELDRYEALILSIYARAGIFAQIDRIDLEPPPSCVGWGGRIQGGEDPAVVVAVQERSQNPIQIVPHPTQTAMITAANVQAGEVYLFFVANIYDPLTESHAGGEAFYASQTTPPGNPNLALGDLNEQLQAQALACLLFESAGQQQVQARVDALTDVLADAQQAAAAASEDNILLQAQAFWQSVETERVNNNRQWLRILIAQLQNNAQANLFQAPGFTIPMAAVRGCAFIVQQQYLNNDVAPAHEFTHIMTDLNNAADGHFDLEDPNAAQNQNTPGHDIPGHIDGKNLMHRYALDSVNPGGVAPAGVELPKRLWDHQATNVHRNNLVIPAQITAILANGTFVQVY